MKIQHTAKGTQATLYTIRVYVFPCQLCKQKSGTFAQTQRESLPNITVQVWLVQL